MNKIILIVICLLIPFVSIANEKAEVSIKKFKFIPQEITIKKGSIIRWTNNEKRQYHSVWFELSGDPEPEYFFPEEFYEKEFSETGTFLYRCGPHPEMIGTVIVTD